MTNEPDSSFEPDAAPAGKGEDDAGPARSLRGKFLLAAPNLVEHNFARTVLLIVRHDPTGAEALVVNRPIGVSLEEACADDVEAARGVDVPLFHGGPCDGPLVALHNIEALARAEAELIGGGEEAPLSASAGELSGSEEPAPPDPSSAVAPGVWVCARREALEALMRHLRDTRAARDEESSVNDASPEAAGAETAEPAEGASPVAVKFIAGAAGWAAGQLERELAEGAWIVADAGMADIYAGGGSDRFPNPPATTPLPAGATLPIMLLAHALQVGPDPLAAVASGIRQWVRLSTRANLTRMVQPRLVPDDPNVN